MSAGNENEKKILLKLRDVRRAKGLSLNALAEKVGVDYQRVGRIERGETQMTIEMLDRISKVLQVPLSQLLNNDDSDLNALQDSLSQKGNGNVPTSVYLIPKIYEHFEQSCQRYNLNVDNTVKVHLATVMYKAIQDIRTSLKDDEQLVQVLFQLFDSILERLVLPG